MIPDEDAVKRAIRSSADEAVGAFIESLDQEVGGGIPPPPKIEISEVTGQPMEFDLLPFGQQGASTAPTQGGGGGFIIGPPPVCCPNSIHVVYHASGDLSGVITGGCANFDCTLDYTFVKGTDYTDCSEFLNQTFDLSSCYTCNTGSPDVGQQGSIINHNPGFLDFEAALSIRCTTPCGFDNYAAITGNINSISCTPGTLTFTGSGTGWSGTLTITTT